MSKDKEQLKALEEQMVAADEAIEKHSTTIGEQTAIAKQAARLRKETEDKLQEAISDQELQYKTLNNQQTHLANLKLDAGNLKKQWEELKRKIAIDELMAKQPYVWDVVPKRIQVHHDRQDSNLVGIDSKEVVIADVVSAWRNQFESSHPNFSHWHIDLRSMVTQYNEAVKQVCTLSVDGKNIAVEVRQRPNAIIDQWIHLPEQLSKWVQ